MVVEARYANSGAVVANEIPIPVGKPLALRLDAADVLHEFCPGASPKNTTVQAIRIISGFKPTKPDVSRLLLRILRHAARLMHFLLVAESQQEFQKWEQAQLAPASEHQAEMRGRVSPFFSR